MSILFEPESRIPRLTFENVSAVFGSSMAAEASEQEELQDQSLGHIAMLHYFFETQTCL